jgi:tellurite resistance protein TehA-like permease
MFDPGSFCYVMASAALSSALHVSKWTILSHIFLVFTIAGYFYLILDFIFHLLSSPRKILLESCSIKNLFKWLTFSAGTSDLAGRLLLDGYTTSGLALGMIGASFTIFLVYSIFCLLFFHKKESIAAISPYWLLMAISCQSTCIAFSLLWSAKMISSPAWAVGAATFWTFGVIIYFLLMSLNLYRMFFFPFSGKDLHPAFWTCMGGAAIAAYGGTQLLLIDDPPLFLSTAKPFIQGSTLIIWAWATAWIPILCLMGVWKFAYFKLPFIYDPSIWAVVFPLGMYTLASHFLHQSIGLDLSRAVPYALIATLSAWIVMATRRLTSLRSNSLQT